MRFSGAIAAGLLFANACFAAEIPQAERRSGYDFMKPDTKAMQDEDTANPGMLWVLDGEALWKRKLGAANKACADCHDEAHNSMKDVAARYPAFDSVLGRPVDLSAFLHAGPLTALLDGTQAVQVDGGAVIGDRGGHAVSFVRAGRSTVDFAFTWSGIATPTYAHIHTGGIGADGPPALPLFAAPSGLPSTFTGVAGTVGGLDPDLVRQIASHPANFYVNLHTADFPGGAVRGQLFDAGHRDAAPTVTS